MKPFRFTLEAVATVRTRAEGAALEAYARALSGLQKAERDMTAAREALERAWDTFRAGLAAGGSAATLAQLRRHAGDLEQRHAQSEALLRQARAAAAQSLQRMLAARQQRELVEKFRMRQRARHSRDVDRETQKFMDELATQRATRAFSATEATMTAP